MHKSVIDGQMTLGMMLAVQYMVGQMDAPLQQFIAFIRAAQDAKISLERLGEIQDQPDEDAQQQAFGLAQPDDAASATAGSDTHNGHIRLEGVSFRYNALSDDVLSGIHMTVPQGKITAIVGASGSGKTTLLKLLLGFYPPTKGRLWVGNALLAQFRPSEWRKRCGAVMQDGFIFSDTIANNITESDEYPDLPKLRRAVDVANIRDFIEGLPLGYNTKIGASGNGISQGQRQRLLIARAVYKNPEFLCFDEATNALDANNERAITENLHSFYGSSPIGEGREGAGAKTVVIVAHRLSTVRHADQIVVLDQGRIVETGTHDELVGQRGAYYHLIKNQLELGT